MIEYDKYLNDEYFNWMLDLVCGVRYSKQISYLKLLRKLHNTEFTYSILKDGARADDGINLRYKFGLYQNHDDASECILGPCSVLEMMIALSIICEESIMDDVRVGDRTGQWFWGMIVSLGLGSMIDSRYDDEYVNGVLVRFLERNYEPNGKGGLFTIRHCKQDLRDVDIFCQLCWYLNTIA